MEICWSRKR